MTAKTLPGAGGKKRGGGFREAALLTKLQKLHADGKGEKMVKEIESRVPSAELPAWLWDAYGRGVLPHHWAMDDLLAAHADGVPPDTLCAALTSEAVTKEAALFLPGIPARSQWLLFTACREGKAEHLRRSVDGMPRPAALAVWAALAGGEAKVPAPPEITREVLALLPDHVGSGRMHGLELGLVCNWFGIEAKDLYQPVVDRIPAIEKLHLLTFGCVLFQMPREELLRLVNRIELDAVQPSWIVWWMGRRREVVDSARDSLAVFEALRPKIEATASWHRTPTLDRAGLEVAKALIAAGETVPDWLLEVGGDSDDLVDRWWPVYSSLPIDRLRALRDTLAANMEGYRKTYLMPLAGLLGESEVADALERTETAITTGNSVTNMETGLLGTIGAKVVEPLRARLDALTAALPQDVNPYGSDYKKFAAVAGLRSALGVALGKVAAAGEPVDERMDDYLMPTPEVYGSHHDDHVCRFFSSDSSKLQRLFGALPEARVRRFVEAWLAFDRSGKHQIESRLKWVIPEARHGLLRGGPSQVERLRELSASTGLPCTLAIYAMTPDEARRPGSLNTICCAPRGLAEGDWPMAGARKMEAVLSLDLSEVPELQTRWPAIRALCLFVDKPEDGFDDASLLPLTGAQCEAGFSADGGTYTLEKILVPPEVFGERDELSEALGTLRDGLGVLPGRVLGAPWFIQEADATGDTFILQADEHLTTLNLGDAGELYVFEDGAFWQCH